MNSEELEKYDDFLLGGESFDDFPLRHISGTLSELKKKIQSGDNGIDPPYQLLLKTVRKIYPTHLWIVGAYTSVGKSFFAVDLAMRLMHKHKPPSIAIFSTEMSEYEYALRLLAHKTTFPVWAIRENKITFPTQIAILEAAEKFLFSKRLFIFDSLYQYAEIEKACHTIKKKHGLDIVFIDFIQNLQGKGSIYERMSILSPVMQKLAKELEITIIALSQISNEAVRENTGVIGYKGAGEIAAACDLGLWMERVEKTSNERIKIIVKKNRHGMLGEGIFRFTDSWTQMTEEIDD